MTHQSQKFLAFKGVQRTFTKPIDLRSLDRDTEWKLNIAAKQARLAHALENDLQLRSNCPICDGTKYHHLVTIYNYPYHQCLECGHVFCKTPPDPQSIKGLYSDIENEKKSVQGEIYAIENLYERRVQAIAIPKVDHITDLIGNAGHWVDIGCGTGELVAAAQSFGWDAIGIESDPEECAFAEKLGTPVLNTFITESNTADLLCNADAISLINVLEHIADPKNFLCTITSGLLPGAWVIVEVPRHPSLSSLVNIAYPDLANRHIYAPDHLHVFSEQSMEKVLDIAGLAAQSLWLFGQDFYEIVTSMAVAINVPEYLISACIDAVPAVQAAIDTSYLSDTMLIVARKEP